MRAARRGGRGWWLVAALATACANNVPQDRLTGPDGRHAGARRLELTDGEGVSRGIVTYPGGDRVDWRLVELPAGASGRLDLELSYDTPRPGLRVSFDVFDRWNAPVIAATQIRGRTHTTSIPRARGTYAIRVFAPRRRDAGAYELRATFVPDPIPLDVRTLAIPDPPRLADVPDPAPVSPPPVVSPPTTAATPPTIVPPAPPQPPPPPPPAPVTGRVLKISILGDELELVVSGGSNQGVQPAWTATLLKADTASPLSGGHARIVRIDRVTTTLRVSLIPDIVSANPRVRLSP